MRIIQLLAVVLATALSFVSSAQIQVTVDFAAPSTPISPLLYGKNNSLSDSKSEPLTSKDWQLFQEAGLRFSRENAGNNSTKYNWRKKLISHPDWYNNVYAHDWDYSVTSAKTHFPSLQLMYGFQLLGKVAKTTSANFDDFAYNNSQWWQGVNQNLAGGGTVNPDATKPALVEGDASLYLQDWPADSTADILPHWRNDLAIPDSMMLYWSMDNEVDIWNGTHDDVVKSPMEAEEFMQKYFAVAKAARLRFPNIKLVGPVTANEWQWYNWQTGLISGADKDYVWLEYFIKRVAEEQAKSGIKLLDVLDIHYYPSSKVRNQVLQYHRVFFDSTYIYPEANGVHVLNGGWDTSIKTEMIFARCRAWLNSYMGPQHGVNFSVTESDLQISEPNVTAVWYASTLGEFMQQKDMALYCPWSWKPGMWEVLHLMSRYNQTNYIPSSSSQKDSVSAYASLGTDQDAATIVLVNRSTTQSKTVNLQISHFQDYDNLLDSKQLSNLPTTETFVSHAQNALQATTVELSNGTVSLSLPPLSITSLLLQKSVPNSLESNSEWSKKIKLFPSPAQDYVTLESASAVQLELIDPKGVTVYSQPKALASHHISLEGLNAGLYFVKLIGEEGTAVKVLVKQ